MKPVVPLLFTIALLLQGIPCRANDDLEKATAYFNEGIALFDSSKFPQAAEKFRKANQVMFNWKLLYNIGQCEAAARHHGLALETFEEYISRGGDDIPMERREEVRSEIRRLREMVGYLDIEGPSGSILIVNELQRGSLPLSGPVAVATGVSHRIVLMKEDNVIFEKEIRIPGTQTIKISARETVLVQPQPVATDASPKMAADDANGPEAVSRRSDSSLADAGAEESSLTVDIGSSNGPTQSNLSESTRRLRTLGIVVTGIGSACLITGGITGAIAMGKANDLEDKYGSVVPHSEKSAYNTTQHTATISTTMFISGGVMGAAGIALLMISKKKREKITTLTPVVGRNAAGILLGGKF
jgi:hypothetical protein